jgi:hypothetical protein
MGESAKEIKELVSLHLEKVFRVPALVLPEVRELLHNL